MKTFSGDCEINAHPKLRDNTFPIPKQHIKLNLETPGPPHPLLQCWNCGALECKSSCEINAQLCARRRFTGLNIEKGGRGGEHWVLWHRYEGRAAHPHPTKVCNLRWAFISQTPVVLEHVHAYVFICLFVYLFNCFLLFACVCVLFLYMHIYIYIYIYVFRMFIVSA